MSNQTAKPLGLRCLALFVVLLLTPLPSRAQQSAPEAAAETTNRYSVSIASVTIDATPVDQPAPLYPEMARAAAIPGEVTVNIAVDEDGTVVSAKATSGHPLLRDAAVQAARQWTFEPPKRDGKPASARGTIVFAFSVEYADSDSDDAEDAEPADGESGDGEGFGPPDEGTVPEGGAVSAEAYDPEKALADAIEEARANPTSPEHQIRLGQLYLNFGRFDEAIGAFRAALQLKPDLELAWLQLGMGYASAGRADDEILAYQQAIGELPNSVRLLRSLGLALARRPRLKDAVPVFERLSTLDPNDATTAFLLGQCQLQLNQLGPAERELRRATALDPKFAQALHSLGALYTMRGQFDDAIDAYSRILGLETRYNQMNRVRRELAGALMGARRYDEAIDILEKIIAESPEFVDAYCQLAEALMMLERLDDARKTLKRAFAIEPDSQCALSFWTALQLRLKKPDEAEESARKLVELIPDNLYARSALVQTLLVQKRFDEAIVEAKAIVAKEPAEYRWHLLLGTVYDRAGRLPAAEVSYRNALAIAPDDAGVLNDVGYFLADNELKLDEAIQMLRRANELMPRNGSLLDSLGWALMKAGKLDEAERCLDDAVTRNPESPAIQEHVGDLALRRGQVEKARKFWEKALTISTATPEQIARIQAKLAESRKP